MRKPGRIPRRGQGEYSRRLGRMSRGSRRNGASGSDCDRGNGGMKIVSGKRFCKILKKHGWILTRTTKSSHFIYTKPGETATLSIPVHGNKDLKKGLQADLMKQAGLSEADL